MDPIFPPNQNQVADSVPEDVEPVDEAALQRKSTAAKRLFWVVIILIIGLAALLGWEIFDLIAGY